MEGLPDDLFDTEKRPGAGVELWTEGVELQLGRVIDANYRHRLHNSPNQDEQRDDPHAETQLHIEVYFLILAIRRLLRFQQLMSRLISDHRLTEALENFEKSSPGLKHLRDMFEHYDDYVLDDPKKHRKFEGRSSPILHSRSDADNVVVEFGDLRIDVTIAAHAALELGKTSGAVWEDVAAKFREEHQTEPPEPSSQKMIELTMSISSVIDYGTSQKQTGIFKGYVIRDATPEDIGGLAPGAGSVSGTEIDDWK